MAPGVLPGQEVFGPVETRTASEAEALYGVAVIYGMGTGAWIDAVVTDRTRSDIDPRLVIWMPLVFGGAAALGAYFIDNPVHIRRGRAMGASAGLVLGLEATGMVLLLPGVSDHFSATAVATTLWFGTSVGLAAGWGLSALTDATPGNNAAVLSLGGLWGPILGGIAGGMASSDAGALPGFILGGEVLGTAGAMLLARSGRITMNQVWAMNGGALLGASAGALLSTLWLGSSDDTLRIGTLGFVGAGTIVGGALGFYLGRPTGTPSSTADNWNLVPSVTPVHGGGVLSLGGTWM